MTLCADVGNTFVKIARVERGRVGRVVTVASNASAREIAAAVQRAQRAARATRGAPADERAAMSSVYPRADRVVAAALARACGHPPLVVDHRSPLPIRIGVRHPARLGPDRICSSVGALGTRGRSAVVVDAGTAITVDLVTNRVFRGGVILPGPALALEALHARTARLPALDFAAGPFPPGGIDRTDLAMRWGAGLAAAGGIRAAVAMLESRAGRRLPVVVSGGALARIRRYLPRRYRSRPHMVLLGLDIIASLSKR